MTPQRSHLPVFVLCTATCASHYKPIPKLGITSKQRCGAVESTWRCSGYFCAFISLFHSRTFHNVVRLCNQCNLLILSNANAGVSYSPKATWLHLWFDLSTAIPPQTCFTAAQSTGNDENDAGLRWSFFYLQKQLYILIIQFFQFDRSLPMLFWLLISMIFN